MKVENPQYAMTEGHPFLLLIIDGRAAAIDAEPKPTPLRHGLVFLGYEFAEVVPPIELADVTLEGFTRDRTVFRLAITFGLEVRYGRFQVGPAREVPDPAEVKALGDLLEDFALPDAPDWAELTAFY